jgi:transposase InsO family protein
MTVKNGGRVDKKWGAIFTCLTTRAIHLELAPALSTDAFILVLRAFIGRRGMPLEIYSDNGTNFSGAEAELRRVLQKVSKEAQYEFAHINWKFNPPAAPHMEGAWERLVRSVKVALNYALPERNPSEDLPRCCLIDIECMINSRPLTYVETEMNTLEALTPNHFLMGSSSGTKPFGNFTDDVHVLRTEWK